MDSVEAVAARVLEHIQAVPTQKISGTQLAQFLQFAFPGFSPISYGTPRLRLFVARYLPGIGPIGRSGGDFVYGLRSPLEPEQEAQKPDIKTPSSVSDTPHSEMSASGTTLSNQLWKSFSSPNSRWHIYANAETAQVKVVAPGHAQLSGPPWVKVPPLSPEVHAQILRGFILTLPDDKQRESLQGLLGQPYWWDRIYSVASELGVLRNWQFYRRKEILKAFSEALKKAGIPLSPRPSAPSAPQETQSEPPKREEAESIKAVGDEDRLRRAVMSAVERMSISELRTLSIPVGYLADELRRDS